MSTTNILSAVSALIVRDSAGSVQWETTLGAIRSAMESEIAANLESDGKIEGALDSLYDSVPVGTGLPGPTVTQTVAASLAGGNLAQQIAWVAKIEDYLSRSPRFVSKRGRSGGLFRVG